ncbi:cytochrome P450 [Streptomyces sp. NBC_00271]|uniref:cytochrome P450 n=1 Tax=Streptomyces sp. NBC_00271 TaxID=2975697 RepID=UPI002E2B6E89|nr:cytochrome P450 [Streptomyces sp. NBC_00271]
MDVATIVEQLMTPEGRADPYPLYAHARALPPIAPVADGFLLASGYRVINAILRDPGYGVPDREVRMSWSNEYQKHASFAVLNDSMLWTNPPVHGQVRSLVSAVFTARRVAALEPAITRTVDVLMDGLDKAGGDGSPVDFMDAFAFRLPVSVICELLGLPESDRYRFRGPISDLMVSLELLSDLSVLDSADAAAVELQAYFRELVAQRRANPSDDLVSALVQVRDAEDARLTDEQLISNLVLLLVAGFETTTNLLGNGLQVLFDHPDIAAGLRAGAVAPADFVEEVLRYDSPVQLTSRLAFAEGLTVDGVSIRAGDEVLLLLGAANRDPRRYDDPDRFDPDRPDIRPLSFGAGAHFCLGSRLARLEATVAVRRLLARYPRLAPDRQARPTRRDRLVLRGYETLPVTLT